MRKFGLLTGALAGAMILGGAAFALDPSWEASQQSGTHQFYVWCTGEADYEADQDGSNYKDAQTKLYEKLKSEGKANCWPIWQGKK